MYEIILFYSNSEKNEAKEITGGQASAMSVSKEAPEG